jgi:hypothetical protein
MDIITPTPMTYRLRDPRRVGYGGSIKVICAILETWCIQNCTGAWQAPPRDPEISFASDDDLVLFLLSREYTYMGKPPIERITQDATR